MDALTALCNRVSCARLQGPVPADKDLRALEACAMRAADHGNMKPWRYLRVQGAGLERLGKVFLGAALTKNPDLTETQRQRFLNMPLRAPFIYVAVCKIVANPKVPRDEQIMAAACSVQNLINAAFALDLGAYWRSGEMADDDNVTKALGLSNEEKLIGFIYLGARAIENKPRSSLQASDFFEDWT